MIPPARIVVAPAAELAAPPPARRQPIRPAVRGPSPKRPRPLPPVVVFVGDETAGALCLALQHLVELRPARLRTEVTWQPPAGEPKPVDQLPEAVWRQPTGAHVVVVAGELETAALDAHGIGGPEIAPTMRRVLRQVLQDRRQVTWVTPRGPVADALEIAGLPAARIVAQRLRGEPAWVYAAVAAELDRRI